MTNNNLPMTLVEYFWKASQQIVMLTPNKAPNPDIEGWGSGFLLLYKGHRFLVTCDHNVHMEDDYSEGERKGIDYGVGIICNYSASASKANHIYPVIPKTKTMRDFPL